MRKASVTVFTALLFPVILALLMTLLEAARMSGTQGKARDAGTAAVSSVMAGYNRNLLEDYGLLFYDGSFNGSSISFEKLEDEFKYYATENLRDDFHSPGGSLFPAYVSQVSTQNIVCATDYRGDVFIRSALDFFKYDAVGEVIELLEKEINEMGEGDSAKSSAQRDTDSLMTTDWNAMFTSAAKPKATQMKQISVLGEEEPSKEPPEDEQDDTGQENENPSENDEDPSMKHEIDLAYLRDQISESPIGAAAESKAKGWLKLVIPRNRTVSNAVMDQSDAPSKTAVDERKLTAEVSFWERASKRVLFGEYVLENYTNFLDESDKAGMRYQVEYILYGKEKDSQNLETALNRIMWIREGMNLLYLLSSDERSRAKDLATAMFSWTENAVIVELATVALLAAWAYAEAIVDVRALLKGKKVVFIKDEESWQLGFDHMLEFFKNGALDAKETDEGITYTDYLRILLYLSDLSDDAYHAMDLIQEEIRQTYDSFLFSS